MEKHTIFTNNGETVELTGKTRDLGHGWEVEVTYTDTTTGWEHYENILGDNGQFFEFDAGFWDFDGSNDTYNSLADAVDHYIIIVNDPD